MANQLPVFRRSHPRSSFAASKAAAFARNSQNPNSLVKEDIFSRACLSSTAEFGEAGVYLSTSYLVAGDDRSPLGYFYRYTVRAVGAFNACRQIGLRRGQKESNQPMGAIKTEAVVLSVSDYSESSRLLTLLTPHEGCVRLIAKGVRGAKSRNRGAVEALSHIEARFSLKNPDALGILSESRVIDPAEYLRQDLQKYAFASLLAELLDRVVPAGGAPGESGLRLFGILRDFLRDLRHAGSPERCMVQALAQLLAELGLTPEAEVCVVCGQGAPAVALSVELGGIVCAKCQEQAGPTSPFNPGLQRALAILAGSDAEKISRLKLLADQPRQLIDSLLDLAQQHLEIRLNSRIFLTRLGKGG